MGLPLGWIEPVNRTRDQEIAHANAMAFVRPLVQYGLPAVQLARGERICLYNFWDKPEVVKDVGFPFTRIHQKTGSCVWAGGTNAVMSSIAAKRLVSVNPFKAFMPFTLQNYAMSRHYMGDDSQGEGSLGSTFARSLTVDGVRDWPRDTADVLPDFQIADGFELTSQQEMAWSSYRNPNLSSVLTVSKQHLVGSAAECKGVEDITAAITNGYAVSFACNNYIGNASVKGSGTDAYVTGYWDGRGGHQQSVHAKWIHPNDGPLYWVQNNWPGNTYPKDPAGGPTCGCWVTEAKVQAAFRLDAEVFAISPVNWFPAEPGIVENWIL